MDARRTALFALALTFLPATAVAQEIPQAPLPPARDLRITQIPPTVSATRIEHTIRTLVGFKTRNTLSDTLSATTGIGAARRWIKAQFDSISAACGGCLQVFYLSKLEQGRRIPTPVNVVDVVAVLKGRTNPNRYVAITGHYDSRATNVLDDTSAAPGADDDGSGVAAVLESARVLSRYHFGASIAFGALAGEEQGLYGGQIMAQAAKDSGWDLEADLNNDIIGNIHGEDHQVNNTVVRVFSESPAANTTLRELRFMRYFGGEVDSPSRQIARYVNTIADDFFPDFHVMMIYRLDRFGRGGDHSAFNDQGFAAVRFTEPHENYTRQHQNVRMENGIQYGDLPDSVDFDYVRRVTALNATSLAALAWAPASPESVTVAGAVQPSTTLRWKVSAAADVAGYKVYWRRTTSPTWDHWIWAGKADHYVLKDVVVDNYLFGVAAVGPDGDESPVVFPRPGR